MVTDGGDERADGGLLKFDAEVGALLRDPAFMHDILAPWYFLVLGRRAVKWP